MQECSRRKGQELPAYHNINISTLSTKFLHNEQESRNALLICHEPFDQAQDGFHELARKRKKLVKIRVIRDKKPVGSGLSRLGMWKTSYPREAMNTPKHMTVIPRIRTGETVSPSIAHERSDTKT